MLNPVNSIDATVIERIVYGFPDVAKAIEDVPPEKWWVALEAADASYIGTLQSSGFSDLVSQALAAAIIRCLKGQLAGDRLTDDEIIDKIRAEVSALDETLTSQASGISAAIFERRWQREES
jgi:hypothetical protein